MVDRVEIFPERLDDGRQVKLVRFKYPLIYKGVECQEVWWDKEKHDETVCLLSKLHEAEALWISCDKSEYCSGKAEAWNY